LEELQQSYPVDPPEDCCGPEKCTASMALEESNEHSQIGFIGFSVFTIG
jgi:hypothetical protein